MAIGCIHQIKSSGTRVPQDVSVPRFDDNPQAEVTDPRLTTISQPAKEISELVTCRLCRSLGMGQDYTTEADSAPQTGSQAVGHATGKLAVILSRNPRFGLVAPPSIHPGQHIGLSE